MNTKSLLVLGSLIFSLSFPVLNVLVVLLILMFKMNKLEWISLIIYFSTIPDLFMIIPGLTLPLVLTVIALVRVSIDDVFTSSWNIRLLIYLFSILLSTVINIIDFDFGYVAKLTSLFPLFVLLSGLHGSDFMKIAKCLTTYALISAAFFVPIVAMRLPEMQFGRIDLIPSVNENRVAIFFAINFVLILKGYSKNSIIKCLLLAFLFVSVFVIGSRSSLFAMLLLLFVYVLKNIKRSTAFLLTILILVVGTRIYTLTSPSFKSNSLYSRYSVEQVEKSGGAKRFIVWQYAFDELIPNKPVFGYGYGFKGTKKQVAKILDESPPAHNVFVDLLLQLGLFGLSTFSLMLFQIYKSPYDGVFKSLFWCLLLIGVGESVFVHKFFWILLYLLSSVRLYEKRNISIS